MKDQTIKNFSTSYISKNSPFQNNVIYKKRLKAIKIRLLRDKFLCSSCYMTFGLSGLIYLLVSIILKNFVSPFLIDNTLKSILLAAFFTVFLWLFENIGFLLSYIWGLGDEFLILKEFNKNYYPIAILGICSIFSILNFLKPYYAEKKHK